MYQLISLCGIGVFVGVAVLFSKNRGRIDWQLVLKAFFLQFVLALLVLGAPVFGIEGPLAFIFEGANGVILKILNFSVKITRTLIS